ncbi:MAG: DUF512 domain-containing protein, partial [Armatimonadetes bacterium]|nr:DUF512 domain-containing protein [Armatimonadota bacterium]
KTESAGTLVTGELARGLVFALSNSLNAVDGIALDVVAVANTWFGGTISVAGLLTACDIVGALAGHGGSGDVFIPDVCLRDGDAFLDDVTPDEVGRSVGRRIRIVPSSPRGLAAALGLTRASRVR